MQLVTTTLGQVAETQSKSETRISTLEQYALSGFALVNELAQQLRESREQVNKLSERIEELRQQQAHTDVRLNALINVVERLIDGKK